MPCKVWDEITNPFPPFTCCTVPVSLGMDKLFHPTLYKGRNYLYMLVLRLDNFGETGHNHSCYPDSPVYKFNSRGIYGVGQMCFCLPWERIATTCAFSVLRYYLFFCFLKANQLLTSNTHKHELSIVTGSRSFTLTTIFHECQSIEMYIQSYNIGILHP